MNYIKILFLLVLCNSCQGQEKNDKISSKPKISIEADKLFEKQDNRFEIRGYKLFYNETILKSDTISNIFQILGKPKGVDRGDYFYDKMELLLDSKPIYNNPGKSYNERRLIVNKNGDTLKIIRKYRIIFKKHQPAYVANARDSILMQIPALEGYVKINGFYIDKNTTREELVQKLKPTIKNADFLNSRGTVSTWYYATENDEPLNKFDPRMRLAFDSYIRIDYVYIDDELYAIDYAYSILE